MSTDVVDVASRYYRDFASQGNFELVPMAADLRFHGPIHTYSDGDRYRRDCTELAAMAQGIKIRHQFVDGEQIHTVYDFDLGLASGPIASSETLTFSNGVMVAADLIIDSTPLRQPPEAC